MVYLYVFIVIVGIFLILWIIYGCFKKEDNLDMIYEEKLVI